jgi:hypothetical protein
MLCIHLPYVMYTCAYICRVANLPDGLSTHMANVHLGVVSANEYYTVDPESGIMSRKIRSPQSLRPHLTVLTDDLYRVYTRGVRTTDYSFAEGEPGRTFRCKVMLLFWTGDYPAQALISGTHSKTCHWCWLKSTHAPEVSRRCWGDYRCYLPTNDPMRRDATYGPVEDRPPSAHRTNADFLQHGQANETYKGPKSRAPYKASGIKELSMLAALPMWDMVWDVLGDMMHIVVGLWKGHIFDMLAGKREPAKPKPRQAWTTTENRRLAKDHADVIAKLKDWSLSEDTKKVKICLHNLCYVHISILCIVVVYTRIQMCIHMSCYVCITFVCIIYIHNTKLNEPHLHTSTQHN